MPKFPIALDASRRYLVDALGTPLFIHGDTPWSLVSNLARGDIDFYLNDRAQKGFTAVIFMAIDHLFTSQTPRYRNAEGNDPFIGMVDGAVVSMDFSRPNEAYWQLVDYALAGCRARGMVVFFLPSYSGIPHNASEGWWAELVAASDASLYSYGQFLANRYGDYGNIVWVHGGDRDDDNPAKQRQIANGINSVLTKQLQTAHGTTNTDTREHWNSEAWLTGPDLIYQWEAYGGDVGASILASYARSPVMPALLFEGQYDGLSADATQCRRQAWQSVLSGGCGHFFGNEPVWHFNCIGRDATPWKTQLDTVATRHMAPVKSLMTSYAWWKLQPKVDGSLVSNGLGSGASRICPALASDRSFAMIWKPNWGDLIVNLGALAGPNVIARWYDPTGGSFRSASGSPLAASGQKTFVHPGANGSGGSDWVLVLN